jgi:SAM-dependent methyltransferase
VLHWSPACNAAHIDALTGGGAELFDVVIASDCLFFRDFHDDLLQTLRRLLKPGSGVGVFLQPSRDGTMQRFIHRCQESGFFATELQDDYCPQVVSVPCAYEYAGTHVGMALYVRCEPCFRANNTLCSRVPYAWQVTNLRREYLARQEELGYAEDVHYPQMLLLRPLY